MGVAPTAWLMLAAKSISRRGLLHVVESVLKSKLDVEGNDLGIKLELAAFNDSSEYTLYLHSSRLVQA
ncbi:MAG: hypothetical protein ACKERG_02650 [Candidatus Hodgkinia cicadicola]